jgi:small subunit ribosomal protein S2
MDQQQLSKETVSQVEELFALGAHLGHKKNRLHPKARKYIYTIVNGVSVIDLTKTVGNLQEAKKTLAAAAKDGKNMLVVCTKKVANQYVLDLCMSHQVPSVTTKWLPGLLTNFDMIIKNVNKLKELIKQRDEGEWDKFVKHERMELDKKVSRLQKFYGGLIYLEKRPDIMLIVDIKKEKNAVIEAKANKLPIVAIVDTNSNPDTVDFPVVINDDSATVIQHVISDLIETYAKAKA